jgi:arylsulfatase A-like enzyme
MRPNLLLVFSDEHRACSLPGEPYSEVGAPYLQRLAREGISFRNCISNYPLCSPYRAMLLSGRWPLQTGVVDNAIGLRNDEFSLGEAFRQAGYRTGYIGKWHLSPDHRDREFIPAGPARHGFEDWQVWSTTNKPHFDRAFTFDPETRERIRPLGYSATLMTDAALDFIGAHVGAPWMLVLSWGPPHAPFEDAPPETLRLYDPDALQFRPNVPSRVPPDIRRYLRGYYAHISALDAELGRLLRKLDETGQSTDTVLVYTSDHGSMLGSHGFNGKRLPFEEACRVPFLLRYPKEVPANRDSDVLLSAIDLFPSLCGLAGVPVPAHCEGSDFSAAMRGRAATPGPQSSLLMHVAKANAEGSRSAPLFRGVRTDRFTYAVADDGRWCLYDNRDDPYQLRNLIGDTAHAKTADDLDELLARWLKQARDPFPLDALRGRRSSYGAVRR